MQVFLTLKLLAAYGSVKFVMQDRANPLSARLNRYFHSSQETFNLSQITEKKKSIFYVCYLKFVCTQKSSNAIMGISFRKWLKKNLQPAQHNTLD